jgi:Lrp/AsnC family leucine-responsive transcriptional regulator
MRTGILPSDQEQHMRNAGELDAADRRLIALLSANARRSTTALAQEVGLSRTAVQGRLARLERNRVILGYVALLGPAAPTPAIRALVSVGIARRPCAPVLDRFRSWPEVAACWSLTGPTDAILMIETESVEALSRLTDRLAAVPGVGRVEAAMVLSASIRPGRDGTGLATGEAA